MQDTILHNKFRKNIEARDGFQGIQNGLKGELHLNRKIRILERQQTTTDEAQLQYAGAQRQQNGRLNANLMSFTDEDDRLRNKVKLFKDENDRLWNEVEDVQGSKELDRLRGVEDQFIRLDHKVRRKKERNYHAHRELAYSSAAAHDDN